METLPEEMIERIMCSESLSIRDMVNFSLTNRQNNHFVTNSKIIWKKAYFKTWPQFVELFDNKFNNDWYAEVRYICDLKRSTRKILSTMPSHFFKINRALSSSDFSEWFELYQEKPQTYYYLIEDLKNIVNTNVPIHSIKAVPIITPGNKTLQYYAMKVLRYLRQLHLIKEWTVFLALPPKLQTLEKGIVFVGKWFQPNSVPWNNTAKELDELTEKVKKNLRSAHPYHPLFEVPKEQLEMWRNENIECDKFDSLHCMQIKSAMADVIPFLFKSHLFNNIFSTVKVLQEIIGSAVHAIFLIIYESVGRRLGVKFEPILFTREGLYLQSLKSNNPEERHYIDFYLCYHSGVPTEFQTLNFDVATTQQVVRFIAEQVEVFSTPLPSWSTIEKFCTRLEFLELVSPSDVSIRHYLARVYILNNINTTLYMEVLMQQRNQAPEEIKAIKNMLQQYPTDRNHGGPVFRKIESKFRPPNLKYAVGMVMKFPMDYYYFELCVICDWDFLALDQMSFYKVLFRNGSYLYVAETKLRRLQPMRSSWDLSTWCFKDIGIHFSHRFEAVFVPNAVKEKEYPEDTAVRNLYNEQIKPRV